MKEKKQRVENNCDDRLTMNLDLKLRGRLICLIPSCRLLTSPTKDYIGRCGDGSAIDLLRKFWIIVVDSVQKRTAFQTTAVHQNGCALDLLSSLRLESVFTISLFMPLSRHQLFASCPGV